LFRLTALWFASLPAGPSKQAFALYVVSWRFVARRDLTSAGIRMGAVGRNIMANVFACYVYIISCCSAVPEHLSAVCACACRGLRQNGVVLGRHCGDSNECRALFWSPHTPHRLVIAGGAYVWYLAGTLPVLPSSVDNSAILSQSVDGRGWAGDEDRKEHRATWNRR